MQIIFITEYMSSGSMSRFLQRARSSGSLLNIKVFKFMILSRISGMEKLDPTNPIRPFLSALLWSAHCARQFNMQHGVHSAEWTCKDWLCCAEYNSPSCEDIPRKHQKYPLFSTRIWSWVFSGTKFYSLNSDFRFNGGNHTSRYLLLWRLCFGG